MIRDPLLHNRLYRQLVTAEHVRAKAGIALSRDEWREEVTLIKECGHPSLESEFNEEA